MMSDEQAVAAALSALDMLADQWAERVDLPKWIKALSVADRETLPQRLDAFCRQCYQEGAYDGRTSTDATLRASGRLAPAVEGDVVEAGIMALEHSAFPRLTVRQIVELIVPIIAAATEARVREECVQIVQQYSLQQQDVLHEGTKVWDAEQVGAACADIIANIRTGATR